MIKNACTTKEAEKFTKMKKSIDIVVIFCVESYQ